MNDEPQDPSGGTTPPAEPPDATSAEVADSSADVTVVQKQEDPSHDVADTAAEMRSVDPSHETRRDTEPDDDE